MNTVAKLCLAAAAVCAAAWVAVVGAAACNNPSTNASSDGSTGVGCGSTSDGGDGACTVNPAFGNTKTATCPECAQCVSDAGCCSSINACYGDPGCASILACEFACYRGVGPGDSAAPDGADCMTLCTSGIEPDSASLNTYTAEYNCWEGNCTAATVCFTACQCVPPEGGTSDATTPKDAGGG